MQSVTLRGIIKQDLYPSKAFAVDKSRNGRGLGFEGSGSMNLSTHFFQSQGHRFSVETYHLNVEKLPLSPFAPLDQHS